jgi:ATP/maltotriose-dependent transcriptional regulator MalT
MMIVWKGGESLSEILEIHRRAGAWFAENWLIEEALHHKSEAADITAAAQLVARQRHDLMNQEQWQRLGRLLNLVPKQTIQNDLGAALLRRPLKHMITDS